MAEKKPVMRKKLWSALCSEAERRDLLPGEVVGPERIPVYRFSGADFYETGKGQNKKIKRD